MSEQERLLAPAVEDLLARVEALEKKVKELAEQADRRLREAAIYRDPRG